MQRKLSKNNVYCAGNNNSSNQDLVLQHMCNHYRRILNARKTVDTSPPYCYKVKRPSTHKPASTSCRIKNTFPNRNISPALTERTILTESFKGSCWGTDSFVGSSRYHVHCTQEDSTTAPVKLTCMDMGLIDRITYDTKNGPAAYCDVGCLEVQRQHNDKRHKCQFESKPPKKVANSSADPNRPLHNKSCELKQRRKFSIQEKLTSSELRGNKNQFLSHDAKSYPVILKKEAVSKLRSLRVYYPPRRKERNKSKTEPELPIGCALEETNCKCRKICICDTQEGSEDLKKTPDNPKESQTSSRDSAYNGGVSSLPDSRSPTPDQRNKKECTCLEEREREREREGDRYYSQKNEADKDFEKKEDWKDCRDSDVSGDEPSRKSDFSISVSSALVSKKESEDRKESLRKMQEDALYVKFIHDITVEVLERCLYTNKALKKVMKRHVKNNLHTLDKERMLREVDNLRIQLGIPEDKNLLNLEEDIGDSSLSSDLLPSPPLYPVISDSEFVTPKNVLSPGKEEGEGEGEGEGEESEGIKQHKVEETDEKFNENTDIKTKEKENEKRVLGSRSDEDDASVIKSPKRLRDKRKGRGGKPPGTAYVRGNSLGTSSQSSENKSKWKTEKGRPTFRHRIFSFSSTSSSSSSSSSITSSENEDLVKKSYPQDQKEIKVIDSDSMESYNVNDLVKPGFSSTANLEKKSRNVSFRNNEDPNTRETIKIKQKKTLSSKTTIEKKKEKLEE